MLTKWRSLVVQTDAKDKLLIRSFKIRSTQISCNFEPTPFTSLEKLGWILWREKLSKKIWALKLRKFGSPAKLKAVSIRNTWIFLNKPAIIWNITWLILGEKILEEFPISWKSKERPSSCSYFERNSVASRLILQILTTESYWPLTSTPSMIFNS